jgi:glyoxylase-like metal-dependent hydrolase (beta-lactamase superfamily II)
MVVMKVALLSSALLVSTWYAQPALAQKASDLVNQAVTAQGGAAALRNLKSVAITADGKYWEPGQSMIAGGDPRFLNDSKLTITWDLTKGAARTGWDRDRKYVTPGSMKYVETVLPTLGFVTDDKGSTPMSSIRVAALLRELERASPTLLLKAMDAKQLTSNGQQQLGKQALPAVSFTAGNTNFIILFDRKTHLPAAIRTLDDDNIYGDSNYDLVLSDWKSVGGVQIAHTLSYQLNGVEVAHVTYRDVTANPTIAADAFNVSEAVKATAKGPATGSVPYQWVLRRLALMSFVDSDSIMFPPGGGYKLVELAPNVQHVQGGTHNNLIVAMKDYLVVFDAPYGEMQSRWVIDAAKKKYPGKPIKYLVLTHHHMDHTGGMRTYVAEGATVIVPEGDKAFFQEDARRPLTIVPDEEQKKHTTAKILEVKDQMSLKDDTEEIRLYNIPNPHVQGMIIGHVVKPNILYVTDLISPRGPVERNAGTIAVGEALRKYGITGATIAGGHGTTAKQADITSALAQN